MCLILFSFVVLTPTYAINLLQPLNYALQDWTKDISLLSQLVSTYFSPLIVIFINFVIIPSIIDFSVVFEDHRRESGAQVSILRRIYFFMVLNTLLIPVTETSSALLLIQQIEGTKLKEWPNMLSSNMMA